MNMPDHIQKIIGSTLTGEVLVGGMGGLPRHGGTMNENGLVEGWGMNPNEPIIPAVSMWSDPLNGAGFPTDYKGEELVFDPVLNRYIVKNQGIGHQVVKEAHVAVKTGGIITGGLPTSHGSMKAEHNIVKESNHIAGKTIGGIGGVLNPVGVDPISHGIDKQFGLGGDTGYVKAGSFGPSVVDPFGNAFISSVTSHDIAKSTGIIGGNPGIGHGVVNSGAHIGMSQLGTVNVGKIGFHEPGVIAHNVGKATLGVDGVMGHNVAKASGAPVSIGFMNPSGPVAQQMGVNAGIGHDIAKNTGVIGVGHEIAKASGGIDFINGHGGFQGGFPGDFNGGFQGGFVQDPVHNVNKVGQSGIAQMGHDPLAASLGHDIAKKTVGQATHIVNMGTNGGVAVGNPMAVAATHGLAKESLHVAGKTLDISSSGAIGGGHIGAGMDIFGHGAPVVHPKLDVKPPVNFPNSYGRRTIR